MQKKWWTKTRTILCSGLVITMLSATGALAVVACGEKNEDIPKVLHNRPVRGFYFQYEEKDYPRMKEVIRYVYDNNHLKKLYEKKVIIGLKSLRFLIQKSLFVQIKTLLFLNMYSIKIMKNH